MLALPFLVAQPTYERATNLTLSIPCTSNGEICPSGTVCVATIINPDQEVLINNQTMTQNAAVFEVNLSDNQTTTLGQYEFSVSCCDGTSCFSKALVFLVTPSGAEPLSSGQGSVLFIIMGVMFFVAIIFFVIGFRAKSVFGKTAGIVGGCIMILILILYSLVVANEVVASSPSLVEGFETFYFVMKMLGVILIAGLFIVILLVSLKAWKIRRGLIDR
jgi:hypothetical protein